MPDGVCGQYPCCTRQSDDGNYPGLDAFAAYGGSFCACCGEDHYEFLCIDHVDNNGAAHRKKVGDVLSWLSKNGYPSGFQVLCINCNFAKGHLGECSHVSTGKN